MAKKNAGFTVGLHLVESLLQPFELVTRVVSELHQEEVSIVACFSVDGDNSDFVVDCAIAGF